jgi:hypothetical protein
MVWAMKRNDWRIDFTERDDDGFWIYLKDGYCDAQNPQCHSIVESSKRAALQHDIARCHCSIRCRQEHTGFGRIRS